MKSKLEKTTLNPPAKEIRIWSAGCAAGEEVYSLAILIHEILGKDFGSYRIRIIGTDIDDSSLEKARKGIYSIEALKNINSFIKKHFFTRQGETYQITEKLRKIVFFSHHDMISEPCMRHFDLIIYRNVLIYFKREIQEQLQINFYHALNENGFLVIGKLETLIGNAANLFKSYNSRESLYYKNFERAGIINKKN